MNFIIKKMRNPVKDQTVKNVAVKELKNNMKNIIETSVGWFQCMKINSVLLISVL